MALSILLAVAVVAFFASVLMLAEVARHGLFH